MVWRQKSQLAEDGKGPYFIRHTDVEYLSLLVSSVAVAMKVGVSLYWVTRATCPIARNFTSWLLNNSYSSLNRKMQLNHIKN